MIGVFIGFFCVLTTRWFSYDNLDISARVFLTSSDICGTDAGNASYYNSHDDQFVCVRVRVGTPLTRR